MGMWIGEIEEASDLKPEILGGASPSMPTNFRNMKSIRERIEHEEKYITFLQKRLNSTNFKNNVSSEEFIETEKKLKKAKLILKMLKA